MEKFMIAYHGGKKPSSKEEAMAHMTKWKEWIKKLGDKVINPGTPLMESKLVMVNNVCDDRNLDYMNGFAVIKAIDMDAAIAIAKDDPFLLMGGTIRVSQMMEMK